MTLFKRLSLSLATAAVLFAAASTCGAAYPEKTVKVVIGYAPGSSTDIVGRIVMQKVAEGWGQPVVIENRGGAGGSIAAAAVAKSAADG